MKGYCCKCKTVVEMKDAKEIIAKNNRPMMLGICPVCGIKVYRILSLVKKEEK